MNFNAETARQRSNLMQTLNATVDRAMFAVEARIKSAIEEGLYICQLARVSMLDGKPSPDIDQFIIKRLQGFGFSAKWVKDSNHNPMLEVSWKE